MHPDAGLPAMALMLIALAAGLLLLGLAAWLYRREQGFAARAATARATVVALRDEPLRLDGSGDQPMQRPAAPVFRYTDATGTVQEAQSSRYADPPGWRIGQQLLIRYDPARPEQAEPATWLSLHMPSLLCAAAGVVFLIGAASALP